MREFAMPCPHCHEVPETMEATIKPFWAIYCPCTEDGEGTIGISEENVIEKWNRLVQKIVTGAA